MSGFARILSTASTASSRSARRTGPSRASTISAAPTTDDGHPTHSPKAEAVSVATGPGSRVVVDLNETGHLFVGRAGIRMADGAWSSLSATPRGRASAEDVAPEERF